MCNPRSPRKARRQPAQAIGPKVRGKEWTGSSCAAREVRGGRGTDDLWYCWRDGRDKGRISSRTLLLSSDKLKRFQARPPQWGALREDRRRGRSSRCESRSVKDESRREGGFCASKSCRGKGRCGRKKMKVRSVEDPTLGEGTGASTLKRNVLARIHRRSALERGAFAASDRLAGKARRG